MNLLRSAVFNIVVFGTTAVLYAAYAPTLLLPAETTRRCVTWWFHRVFRLQRAILGLDFEFRGLQNIPDGAFMGTAGLAPSHEQLEAWNAREEEFRQRGGTAPPPDPEDAVPSGGRIAKEGLRTGPPRENAGNMDVKQLTRGSRLYIPVAVPGGLYSVGDGHFAQGDGEVCITAIEMGMTVGVRFTVHKGVAAERGITTPRFSHPGYFQPPAHAIPRNFIATVGYPIRPDGVQEGESAATLAARNALLSMLDLIVQRGYTPEQAYAICSVAVDLKISNIVDLPNITVSAFLPQDIFVG